MIDKKLSIIFPNSLGFIQALIRIERQLLPCCLKVLRLLLKHVRESSLLILNKFIQLLINIFDIPLIPPLLNIPILKQFLLFIVQRLLLLDKLILDIIPILQNLPKRLMLHEMVLHATA